MERLEVAEAERDKLRVTSTRHSNNRASVDENETYAP